MDEYKVLIYHYPSNGDSWYDATDSVVWYGDKGNCWNVKFRDMDKFYLISYSKMKIFSSPEEIQFAELYYKGTPCYGVSKLICFDNVIYKIFYINGYKRIASAKELKIVKNTLKESRTALGVMQYFRQVVEEIVESEEDSFLVEQFDNIECVNDESVLALYLTGRLGKNKTQLYHPIICPFGINYSQSQALSMMFENRISIVEGPPGTGKTQTILNFISNAVINGMSVAVVSNNNSATDNVYEKLKKYGYSFIAAPLGNADNVDKFFEEYDSDIPTLKTYDVDVETINELFQELPNYFLIENEKKKKIEEKEDLELEYKHFLADNENYDFNLFKIKPNKVKSNDVIATIVKLKETQKKLSFITKLKIRFKLKMPKAFFSTDPNDYLVYLNNLYYLSKINEAKKYIDSLDEKMGNETLDEKMKTYSDSSKKYFESKLNSLFKNSTRGEYEKANYKRIFREFVKDYPVVLSSTYSLAKCSQRGFLFDYLIVDESSQVNMASAILSMGVAKNLIVVGDIKQLPQIDDSSFKERNEQLLNLYQIPRTYSYYGNSILSSILSLYGDSVPKTMLKEHYRCNPGIIGFCNKRFYNNQLVIYTENKNKDYSMKLIKTVPGNFARKNPDGSGLYNQREIDEIKELLDKEKLKDVGVIAPYRYHTQVAQEQLGDDIDASTIHKFQGREKKTIIFSSVINDSNEFVENDNLINVAVSRAVDKFILVTSDKVANSNSGVLSDLVNYIKYHDEFGEALDGTVKSIYDLLYEDYKEALNKFRSKHRSKEYDSEMITRELLKIILRDRKYFSLWFTMHVSLKDFINPKGLGLTDEEYSFYKNPNAHADFLIYNKMSHKPVLVIEVDGVSYHEQKKEQQIRDSKKDSILEKAGIILVRLKTNESREEKKIKFALDNLCK